ncbi:perlucin-like [Topomyia yanbarensis]|uniref:perlucin-like n=1 Tax=Topomyia yanbarensis TaxID=2498891 RepID=UPI00273BB565|nr:perlucin-like [Topomyia yanbarensis]
MYFKITTVCFIVAANLFLLSDGAGKKYFIPSIRANWFKANEFCNSLQMRLATIKSKEENDAIAKYVKTTDKFSEESCSFWIGATDLAEEGTFIWTGTGEQLTYTNWRRGEPNDENGSEDCLQLAYIPEYEYIWSWNDNVCAEQSLYFICENVNCDCITNF